MFKWQLTAKYISNIRKVIIIIVIKSRKVVYNNKCVQYMLLFMCYLNISKRVVKLYCEWIVLRVRSDYSRLISIIYAIINTTCKAFANIALKNIICNQFCISNVLYFLLFINFCNAIISATKRRMQTIRNNTAVMCDYP